MSHPFIPSVPSIFNSERSTLTNRLFFNVPQLLPCVNDSATRHRNRALRGMYKGLEGLAGSVDRGGLNRVDLTHHSHTSPQ